jgi:hypothetical protein
MSTTPTFSLEVPEDLVESLLGRVLAKLQAEPERRYLSKVALAARYGVTARTIKTWRTHGLPGIRVGRDVMFDTTACDRWVESHG